jgi:hypothetical protein
MGKFIPLDGMMFGRLTAIRRAGSDKSANALWECRCVCGAIRTVSGNDLRRGLSTSCGCKRRDTNTKHGHAGGRSRAAGEVTYLYRAWQNMKARCYNPKVTHYDYYGGRGIQVCDEWRDNFEAFAAHMGERPTTLHSLDRIDTDKDYTPTNTRWADKHTQATNRRNAIMVTFNGTTKPLAYWCKQYGLQGHRTRYLLKSGRTPEQIFSKEQIPHGNCRS